MVPRCGGACHAPQSCGPAPAATRVTTVEVMLVLSRWPHGEHSVVCTEVEVETHTSCACGCRTTQEDCNPLQVTTYKLSYF